MVTCCGSTMTRQLCAALLGLLGLVHFASAKNKNATLNRFEDMDEHDPVKITRCDAVCMLYTHQDTQQEHCHNKCMSTNFTKSGVCPTSFYNVTPFAQACVNVCRYDSQCPATEKCCVHSCGVTCQPAFALSEVSGLAPVPFNLTASEKRGKSVVLLEWKTHLHRTDSPWAVLYLIQERDHFGRYFNEEKLGPWASIHSGLRNSVVLRNIIKSARWYQFRVAAVNANGTRGFSEASQAFFLSRVPSKPRRPKKLRVVNVKEVQGAVSAEVRWGPPKSEVPVQRYKVFWSKRLPGTVPRNESDTVVVHLHSVPQDRLHYQLHNLEKGKLYYIQVQAMAVYGRDRLKSEKAGMVFNTTRIADQFSEPIRRKHRPRHIHV